MQTLRGFQAALGAMAHLGPHYIFVFTYCALKSVTVCPRSIKSTSGLLCWVVGGGRIRFGNESMLVGERGPATAPMSLGMGDDNDLPGRNQSQRRGVFTLGMRFKVCAGH